jgi:hypothetical protein
MNHETYIALKRFRTELWRSVPPFVTIRWLFNKHPKWVVPVALVVAVIAGTGPVLHIINDWASIG